MRSRPPRRLRLVVAFSATAGLFWLTSWLLGKGDDGAGIANVLALPVAILGSVAAFYSLRSRRGAPDQAALRTHASTLLDQVITAEARALQQLLGDTGRPEPADIGFASTHPDAAGVRWRVDGGPESGSLNTVAEFYESLGLGRLLVLGEPGSGKTVLTIRLLLDLAEKARTETGERIRVPVRLSLPSFSETHSRSATVRERLDTWIAEQLTVVYGVPRSAAKALLADGWILPILDGLDEMDGDTAAPRRANEVIDGLNTAAGPHRWPVVVACRMGNYRLMAGTAPLQDTTAVTMEALESRQIIGWLAHRFPDPSQPDGIQARWRPVLNLVRTHPAGRLAKFLSSPLSLYLAVNVYRDPVTGPDPRELRKLSEAELDDFLQDRLIPAVVEHYPGPDGTRYRADDVRTWLSTLANHLAWMGAYGYSRTDIQLHELWRTSGDPASRGRRVRLLAAAIISGLTTLLVSLLFLRAWFGNGSSDLRAHPERWFYIIPSLLGVGVFVFRFAAETSTRTMERMEPRLLLTGMGLRKVLRAASAWLLLGVSAGIPAGIAISLLSGIGEPVKIVLGTMIGFGAIGFVIGLIAEAGDTTTLLKTANRPSEPQRQVRGTIAAQSLILALVLLVLGSLPAGIIDGVFLGSAAGLGLYLGGGPTPRLRQELAIRAMVREHRLPGKPEAFLDWAYGAGLLRLAGTATQFRHREVQERLTTEDP
ncbi:NACHT domain-containing protein [Amycolatopsis orientalis]|uniref:NACHT domain-containing protein n=1 Tax=Amycolatopsis orientalis TaxID=31958 RepID=UPI0003FD4D5D|nr:NACHT domain-containing protein [Amycolatopsis orientalis]